MSFKNVIFVLLAIGLGTSVALNYFLYHKAFVPLQLSKLDPAGVGYYSSEPIEKSADKPTIMFYGDSRALSWPFYKTDDYQFINRAIGNQTSVQILQRFDQHVTPHQPQLLLVQMCVNDLKMIPLFPKKRDNIVQNCKNNIQLLIDKARQINSKVALTTVFPLGGISIIRKAFGTTEPPIINGIQQINTFIQAQAAADVVIFDSYDLLAGENRKINPAYSRDWLHLNAKGYEHLNTNLEGFIERTMSEN